MALQAQVYVVDDDEAVRDSIVALLMSFGFRTSSFCSGVEFLSVAHSLEPGCIVSDVRMPGLDGLALLARLKELHLRFAVVLITGHADIKMAVEAIRLGASDFVEKPCKEDVLIAAVRHAHELLSTSEAQSEMRRVASERLSLLTPRERDVLERVVAGMPSKIVAYNLSIGTRTVEFYRTRIMAKMQAGSLSELVRLALAAGITLKR